MATLDDHAAAALRELDRGTHHSAPGALEEIRGHLHAHCDVADRTNPSGAHLTVSAVIVDETGEHVLLCDHPRFGQWMQLGGHLESFDATLIDAVRREVVEETGLTDIVVHPALIGVGIYRDVTCPRPHGRCTHLDLRYLVVTDPDEPLVISDESDALAWFHIDQLPDRVDGDLGRMLAGAHDLLR
jgi:8-oxo-dGTP pyrophosphatase MutT (NUDIX family)